MIDWTDIKDELPKDYAYKGVKVPRILFCLYSKFIYSGYFLEGKFYSDDGKWYNFEEVSHWAECNIP